MPKNDFFYSYAKLISELIRLSRLHNYKYKIIGKELFEKTGIVYPLYRFTINPSSRPSFCIIAGVHGYEVAGPLTMPELFANQKKYLDRKICYYIYPVINPTAFDLRKRQDDDGYDLNTLNKNTLKNKGFCEIQSFYKDVKNKKFEVLISLHEDVDLKKFYAYVFEKKKEMIYRKIIKASSKYTDILCQNRIYGSPSDNEGLVINSHDQSLEDRLYREKKAKISLCTETPGKLNLKTRISINLNNIRILNDYTLNMAEKRSSVYNKFK